MRSNTHACPPTLACCRCKFNYLLPAGAPWVFEVPELTGFQVAVGHNFGGHYNYPCATSKVANACVVVGSAQASPPPAAAAPSAAIAASRVV